MNQILWGVALVFLMGACAQQVQEVAPVIEGLESGACRVVKKGYNGGHETYEYDNQGRRVSTKFYDKNGQPAGHATMSYEANKCIVKYYPQGYTTVATTQEYFFDATGQVSKTTVKTRPVGKITINLNRETNYYYNSAGYLEKSEQVEQQEGKYAEHGATIIKTTAQYTYTGEDLSAMHKSVVTTSSVYKDYKKTRLITAEYTYDNAPNYANNDLFSFGKPQKKLLRSKLLTTKDGDNKVIRTCKFVYSYKMNAQNNPLELSHIGASDHCKTTYDYECAQ